MRTALKSTHLRSMAALMLFLVLNGLLTSPAASETTGTWMGTVAYINRTHIGVKAQSQTKDFLIPGDFKEVFSSDGKSAPLSDVTVGTMVRIAFTQSTLFGSTRVTRIDLVGLAPMKAPVSLPTAEPTP